MAAFYNENDPKAAAWLRELIKADLIAPGVVDERSITDLHPTDLDGYEQCHFFAGIGGWSYALRLAGIPDSVPVWTGSCPCQPFSAAGTQEGVSDERHLWPSFARLIDALRPPIVFGEQVASKAGRQWLAGIFADLEAMGYCRAAADLCAASVGAPHIRQRIYWTAHAKWDEQQWPEPCRGEAGRMGRQFQPVPWNEPWQAALARLRALDDGLPRCVAGTDAARNAIVPQVAAQFIQAAIEAMNEPQPARP